MNTVRQRGDNPFDSGDWTAAQFHNQPSIGLSSGVELLFHPDHRAAERPSAIAF